VADDEIATTGPLNRFVGGALAGSATSWHKGWGQWILLGLVALHIGAIVYYRLARRKNLVRPMIGGDKPLPAGTPASNDNLATRGLALLLAAGCAALAIWVYRLGG
jgi:cytochrome b